MELVFRAVQLVIQKSVQVVADVNHHVLNVLAHHLSVLTVSIPTALIQVLENVPKPHHATMDNKKSAENVKESVKKVHTIKMVPVSSVDVQMDLRTADSEDVSMPLPTPTNVKSQHSD